MAKKKTSLTRRAFIITGAVVGGGVALGLGGLAFMGTKMEKYSGRGFGDGNSLNAFIHIKPDGTIRMAVPRSEMGQGVHTSIPMLLAEELEVEFDKIEVFHPQVEGAYANVALATNKNRPANITFFDVMAKVAFFLPYIGTGGSTAIKDAYDHQRIVGAMAREMLISAAAKKWSISNSDCKAEKGHIINTKNNEKLSYGELSEAASMEEPPSNPKLKSKGEFRYIGKPIARLDIPKKVDGSAVFGLDVREEGMLHASVRHAPIIGGKITGISNEDEVLKKKGVQKIVHLNDNAVAVVADNTWRARNAVMALDLEIDANGNDELSTEGISETLRKALDGEPTFTAETEGDIAGVLSTASKVVEAEYEVPYLAHACMEPLSATVLVNGEKGEMWASHQIPTFMVWAMEQGAGITAENCTIHVPYLGGGFGRRAEMDFLKQACMVAKEMEGTPVQLSWSREECMKNDVFRPQVVSRFKASLDDNGRISGWHNRIALQAVILQLMNRNVPFMAPPVEEDMSSMEGAWELPYHFGAREVQIAAVDLPVSVGTWRSVGSSQNAFFTECFIDEMANAANKDPFEFRRSLLGNHPRFKAVLEKVAQMSNWQQKLPAGKFRGVALHKSFGSIVGQVAEITMTDEKQFTLDKVYNVIDCGKTVNPDTIEAQMQSGIVFGLSAALYGEITIEDGRVQQVNFPQYEVVKLNTMPVIVNHIMESDEAPGGVGEPGTPPIAPALANAIFAATGERLRSLPLTKHGYICKKAEVIMEEEVEAG